MRRAPAVVLLAASLSATSAAARGDSARINSTTIPHVLRLASTEDVATLNPEISSQTIVAGLSQLTAAYFFRYDRENRMRPELATLVPTQRNGGIARDGLTVTFHLRRGVRWSDGRPFDADDAIYTIGAIQNRANSVPSRDGFDRIKKMDEPNKYTLVLHLKERYGGIVPTMFGSSAVYAVLPKHVLGGLHDFNHAPFNARPIGIGPFRYVTWKRGDSIELERNPYYWRGQPALAKVVVKIIPNRNAAFAQLETGEVDVWSGGGSLLPRFADIASVRVLRRPGYQVNLLVLNLNGRVVRDRAVRVALRYATDRRAIRDKVSHGVGILQDVALPKADASAPRDIGFTAFDPAKANAVLDAGGWKRGPDGIRVKNGVRLSLTYVTDSATPNGAPVDLLIRSWWQDIGADVTLRQYPSSMLFAPYDQGGILDAGKFDVMLIARFYTIPLDPRNEYACDQIPPAGQNASHYCNRKVDALIGVFDRSYDDAERAADLREMYHTIESDVPVIVITGAESIYAVNRDIKNFTPNSITPFDDMLRVDI